MRTKLGVLSVILGLTILGGSWWVIDSGRVRLEAGAAKPTANVSLPPCPDLASRPTLPVIDAWVQAVTEYYAVRALGVTDVSESAQLLDVAEQREGLHQCLNPDGVVGGWMGSVPRDAIAAVMLTVSHDPYEATGTSFNFVTLASSGAGWRVVAEATGP